MKGRRFVLGVWIGFGLALASLLAVAAVAWAHRTATTNSPQVGPTTGSSRHLSERLHAFARPQVASDRLSPPLAAEARGLTDGADEVDESLRPGTLLLDRSRLLLANLGVRKKAFFGFPTSKGKVCILITGGPAGCAEDLDPGSVSWGEFDPDRLVDGVPMAVYGLAADDVVRVEVVAGGERHLARLANNAFFYEPADPAAPAPEGLVVTRADGSETTISIPPPPPGRL